MSQLAILSGVSRPFISQIESKKYIPTIETLCKLCRALNISPNEMIEEKYWKG